MAKIMIRFPRFRNDMKRSDRRRSQSRIRRAQRRAKITGRV